MKLQLAVFIRNNLNLQGKRWGNLRILKLETQEPLGAVLVVRQRQVSALSRYRWRLSLLRSFVVGRCRIHDFAILRDLLDACLLSKCLL